MVRFKQFLESQYISEGSPMPSQEVVANRIHKKFPETKGMDVSYRILDDGNVELKIGEQVGVGTKIQFKNFCTAHGYASFGNIDFKKRGKLNINGIHYTVVNSNCVFDDGTEINKTSFKKYISDKVAQEQNFKCGKDIKQYVDKVKQKKRPEYGNIQVIIYNNNLKLIDINTKKEFISNYTLFKRYYKTKEYIDDNFKPNTIQEFIDFVNQKYKEVNDEIKKDKLIDKLKQAEKEGNIQLPDNISDYSEDELKEFAKENNIKVYQNDGDELEKDAEKTLNSLFDPKSDTSFIEKPEDQEEKSKQAIKDNLKHEKDIKKFEKNKEEFIKTNKIFDAKRVNNGDYSDIRISLSDLFKNGKGKDFFIEFKYDTNAPVSHFGCEIINGKIKPLDGGRVETSARNTNKNKSFGWFKKSLADENLVKLLEPELNEFYEAYANIVRDLKNNEKNSKSINYDELDGKTVKGKNFPDALIVLSDICKQYIHQYQVRYKKYLDEFTKLVPVKNEDQITSAILSYFPSKENHDNVKPDAENDRIIKEYVDLIKKSKDSKNKHRRATELINKIYRIHNKLIPIILYSRKNKPTFKDLMSDDYAIDRALYTFHTFVSKSKNNRIISDKSKFKFPVIDVEDTDYARRLAYIKTSDKNDMKYFLKIIKQYYGSLKDVAYMQIGKGTYYYDKNFDPLGIIEEYKLQNVLTAFDAISCELYIKHDLKMEFRCHVFQNENKQNGNVFSQYSKDGKRGNLITKFKL